MTEKELRLAPRYGPRAPAQTLRRAPALTHALARPAAPPDRHGRTTSRQPRPTGMAFVSADFVTGETRANQTDENTGWVRMRCDLLMEQFAIVLSASVGRNRDKKKFIHNA